MSVNLIQRVVMAAVTFVALYRSKIWWRGQKDQLEKVKLLLNRPWKAARRYHSLGLTTAHTPPQHLDLGISLPNSSPPDGTQLRQACAELPSPAKRFTERMTRVFEAASSENLTLTNKVKEQAELLHARKARKKGKRVALKGRFVFSTQEVLDIARSAEAESSKKKPTTRPKKRIAKGSLEAEANGELDVVLSDSGSGYIVVSMRG